VPPAPANNVRSRPAPKPATPPVPARRLVLSEDLVSLALALAVLVTGLWLAQGGWHELAHARAQGWRIAASLSGMWTSLLGMYGLFLAARLRWMERAVGLDRLFTWHRIVGDAMGIVLAFHVVTSVMAERPLSGGLAKSIVDLTGRVPYMALATGGTVIVAVVVITSLKAIRNRMAYETWYFVHLTAYFGLAISLPHQLTLGSSFGGVRALQVFWLVLNCLALATALGGRWWKTLWAATHPMRVTQVRRETPTTVSVTLGGRPAKAFRADAGQFVVARVLRDGQWWKSNPYSLSAVPDGAGVRMTIKDRGDASRALVTARPGDRVAIEGPFGVVTPEVFGDKRPVFIAGGVGVTPVVAMLGRLGPHRAPVVILRARHADELPLLAELTAATERLGGQVHVSTGRTSELGDRDPLNPQALRAVVGPLEHAAAVVAGPPSLLMAARRGLLAAGMAKSDIHMELPWW